MMFMRFSYTKLRIIVVKTIPVPYMATSAGELFDLVKEGTFRIPEPGFFGAKKPWEIVLCAQKDVEAKN